MLLKDMPKNLQEYIIPYARDLESVVLRCIGCGKDHAVKELLYTCPGCESLLDVVNLEFDKLRNIEPEDMKKIFAYRRILDDTSIPNDQALKGVFRFHELVMPVVGLEDVVYLGEAGTPHIRANPAMEEYAGDVPFEIKHDGIEPSVSFKDRGMSAAVSFINYLLNKGIKQDILGICASTGDTSASAALYLAYLTYLDGVKSGVILPHNKVTPAQQSQPCASGASVIEIYDSVFDDCMDIVAELTDQYDVALLNSKNGVRITGQKTFAFETAERYSYEMDDKTVVVPVGNAGNITSVLSGFLDLYDLGLIESLPNIVGVQSEKADPIVSWLEQGVYVPVKVDERGPSTAQAAYIGKPVSFPRVAALTERYQAAGEVHAVRVSEQEIMDTMLIANQNGLTVCTQGGEAIAGLKKAAEAGVVNGMAMVDSTSHQIKFAGFQLDYYNDRLGDYGVVPNPELVNLPNQADKDVGEVAKILGLK